MNKYLMLLFFISSMLSASPTYYYDDNQKIYVEKISSNHDLKNLVYYKKVNSSAVVGIDGKIIVKLHSHVDINDIPSKYKVKLLRKLGDNLYLLETSNKENVFNITAALHESGLTIFSQPNFIQQRISR